MRRVFIGLLAFAIFDTNAATMLNVRTFAGLCARRLIIGLNNDQAQFNNYGNSEKKGEELISKFAKAFAVGLLVDLGMRKEAFLFGGTFGCYHFGSSPSVKSLDEQQPWNLRLESAPLWTLNMYLGMQFNDRISSMVFGGAFYSPGKYEKYIKDGQRPTNEGVPIKGALGGLRLIVKISTLMSGYAEFALFKQFSAGTRADQTDTQKPSGSGQGQQGEAAGDDKKKKQFGYSEFKTFSMGLGGACVVGISVKLL